MKFIFFNAQTPYSDIIYKELKSDKRVIWYKRPTVKFLSVLRDYHTSIKANDYFDLPFQWIWNKSFFNYKTLKKDEVCIFLFEEGNKQAYRKKYIKYIRKKYNNAKLVFTFANPTSAIKSKYVKFVEKYYDLIITFNHIDSNKYGWLQYSGIYSKSDIAINKDIPVCDIFFVGYNKGRLDILRKIYHHLVSQGVNCCFYISGVEEKEVENSSGIHYNEYLDYLTILQYVKKANCVLEVLQEGQKGSSLRVMEALVYEKKLLTNNEAIKEERYFRINQMKVIEDVADIDIKFVKERQGEKQYQYDGRVSPKRFLDYIEHKLQER